MFKNLPKISNIIHAEGERIVNLDTSLIAIYNNFHLLEDKDRALAEYKGMLEHRRNISEIENVQSFLLEIINVLDKYKITKYEHKTHKARIKHMEAQLKNQISIENDEEVKIKIDIQDNKVVNNQEILTMADLQSQVNIALNDNKGKK